MTPLCTCKLATATLQTLPHLLDYVQDVFNKPLNGAQADSPQQPTQHRQVREKGRHACSSMCNS
jgi:hypothetical protein